MPRERKEEITLAKSSFGKLVDCLRDFWNEKERYEAALTEIRDLMPLQNDEYARRVFSIAANALDPT